MVGGRLKSYILLAILLPGLYVSDIIYGIFDTAGYDLIVTPGQIIRGSVLLVSALLLFKNRWLLFGPLGIFLASLCFLLLISTCLSRFFPEELFFDFNAAIKILYGPFVVAIFVVLFRSYQISMPTLLVFLEAIFYLIGISLFLMDIMGVGRDTYGNYAYGFKGVFKAQNDIGLSASVALSAAVFSCALNPGLTRLLLITVAMLGVAGIGTRTAMATPLLVTFAVCVVLVMGKSSYWQGKRKLISTVTVLPLLLLLSLYASVNSYTIATTGESLISTSTSAEPTTYQKMKMERTKSGQIYRGELLNTGLEYVSSRDWLNNALGEGAYSYRYGVSEYWPGGVVGELKYVEMDWFDFYGQYGIIFTLMIHIFYLGFLIRSLYMYLYTREPVYGCFSVMLGVYLAHSAIAGHALNSPIVSTQIAAIIGFLYIGLSRNSHSNRGLMDSDRGAQ